MKKSVLAKKIFYFPLVSFVFIFSLFFFISISGCKSHKKEEADTEITNKLNNLIYENTFNKLNNISGNRFYIPDSFIIELNRHIIKDGLFYTFFELKFPEKIDFHEYGDFYDCNKDNGAWVDRVLFSLEEERIGSELQKMEDIVQTGIYAPDEQQSSSEAEKKVEEIKVIEIRTSDDALGFMEFGKEIFLPLKDGDNWIFINAFEEKVTRSFYDKLFRCYSEEKWEIDGKGKEELKKTVKTEFFNDTYKPSSKTVSTDNSEKKQSFNDKGFLIKEENYNINSDKKESEKDKKGSSNKNNQDKNKFLQSVLNLKYDNEDRVVESNVVEYKYDNNNEIDYLFNKKYLYKYNSDDIPANFDYYEDGKLKIRNIYESAGTYTSEVCFDEGFHVKSFYKDGKLIKEVFITNNSNERIKNYE